MCNVESIIWLFPYFVIKRSPKHMCNVESIISLFPYAKCVVQCRIDVIDILQMTAIV